MANPFDKLDPIDIIALAIIVGCFTSMIIQGNSAFKDILLTVVGWYFGRKSVSPKT